MVPERVAELLNQGVAAGVYPGGVLLAARDGKVLYTAVAGRTGAGPDAREVTPETEYDLASMTKILCTTRLIMGLVDRGRLDLDAPLKRLLPGPWPPGSEDKRSLPLKLLLAHASGLPAWHPFYEEMEPVPPADRRAWLRDRILSEAPAVEPMTTAIYSDLNFLLLGMVVEQAGKEPLNVLFDREVGLGGPIGYRPLDAPDPRPDRDVASTEIVPRRGGEIRRQVHDDNAFALGGVAGHAGLFGSAGAVWEVFRPLTDAYKGLPGPVSRDVVRRFFTRSDLIPDSTWALGFDTPNEIGSSAGDRFSKQSVGHLGFTGTALWHDPTRDLTVILLTNRVHPTAENQAIKKFRPRLYDAVVDSL